MIEYLLYAHENLTFSAWTSLCIVALETPCCSLLCNYSCNTEDGQKDEQGG
jgi:hypothetical protein